MEINFFESISKIKYLLKLDVKKENFKKLILKFESTFSYQN